MTPRNTKPIGNILNHDYMRILTVHPEAFDCIVFPAKDPTHDESLADNTSVATVLVSDERAQEYDEPVQARAMLIPAQELDFDATESGLYEGFTASSDAINLMISIPGLRRYSLVQWLEYTSLEQDSTIERTVYIQDVKPMGRTLVAGMVYQCYPMPAVGEVPKKKEEGAGETEGGAEGENSASYDGMFKPYGG